MVAGEKLDSLYTPAGSEMVIVTTVVALNSSAIATNRAMPEASVILVWAVMVEAVIVTLIPAMAALAAVLKVKEAWNFFSMFSVTCSLKVLATVCVYVFP